MEYSETTRAIGLAGEDLSIRFLTVEGMEILDRNYIHKGGEIDIIFRDTKGPFFCGITEYIVFAEVKYRTDEAYGNGMEAVTCAKQRRIVETAKYYLYKNHYPESTAVRFDVLSVFEDKIMWIKDAFSAF